MATRREGSNRLDRTLASEDFAYKENITRLVRNQILKSSVVPDDGKVDNKEQQLLGGKHLDDVTQYWSSKIWPFADELRSASTKHTGKLERTDDNTGGRPREWKLKDESDSHRVMYREGPEGTPFHTLCIDGVVEGDFTCALCVAWESPLFKEWWPQFTVPTFKIVESKWLRRIRVGQDLASLRFKVPWPMAQREVVMSAFEMEHLQEELLIGLVESVPDSVEINENIHGYSAADLPPLTSHVRMELNGGFVMQRISEKQFFFRTIISLDMKLDLVPPWLINFMSRQLAGQGLRLYQKAVLAATYDTSKGKAFQKILKSGYLYERVRSGLEAKKEARGDSPSQVTEKPATPMKETVKAKGLQGSLRRIGSTEHNRVVPYPVKDAEETPQDRIRVENSTDSSTTDEFDQAPAVVRHLPEVHEDHRPVEEVVEPAGVGAVQGIELDVATSSKGVQANGVPTLNHEDEVREYDDPEVVWAVSTLDKMISYTRSCIAAEQHAPATTLESTKRNVESRKVESKSSSNESSVSRKALATDSKKPPEPSSKNEFCDIAETVQAAEQHAPTTTPESSKRNVDSSKVESKAYGNEAAVSREAIRTDSNKPPEPPSKYGNCDITETVQAATALSIATDKLEDNGEEPSRPHGPQAAAEKNVKSTGSSVESRAAVGNEAVSGGASILDRWKNPLVPPPTIEIPEVLSASAPTNVLDKSGNVELSSKSRGPHLLPSSGEAESPGQSSFWSISEIEVVSSHDDTDTDVGASSAAAGQPVVGQRPDPKVKCGWRKWRWTCFSASTSETSVAVLGGGNFYTRDSGENSKAAHSRSSSVVQHSDKYTTQTRGDTGSQRSASMQRVKSQGETPDRFVTLGHLLLDGGES